MMTQISKRLHRLILVLGSWFWVISMMIPLGLGMDVDLWSLAKLPEGELVWQDKPLEINQIKASATRIRSYLSKEGILNFYQQALTQAHWKLRDSYPESNILAFIKENRFMYVAVVETSKDLARDVYLISSPNELTICKELENYFLKPELANDAPGKDPLDLPRYPGSKRRLNVFTPLEGVVLMYEVKAQPQEVAAFYRRSLKVAGWREEQELIQRQVEKQLDPQIKEKTATLCFYQGDNSLLINIFSVPGEFGRGEINASRSLIVISKNINAELTYPKEVAK